MRYLQHLFVNIFRLTLFLMILGSIVVCYGYFYIKNKLPDVEVLKDIHLQVPMKVYTSDNKLIGEFGEVRRIPISLSEVPPLLIKAVLSTEDARFYEHSGVDPIGLLRAAKQLLLTGKKEQGASTIPMQVARNFFLTRKKTFTRKLNEILLAIMIDHEFSKDKILELYLNKIYLGNRAYGVAAAAQVYYGKKLNELTLAEMAMIAGLAQAPSVNNPIANPATATDRRDHVLERMLELKNISQKEYLKATQEPLNASYHGSVAQAEAPYLAEMVRQALFDKYGEAAYNEGFNVYTTVDSHTQAIANDALRLGLLAYEKRHYNYRGQPSNLGATTADNKSWLSALKKMSDLGNLKAVAFLKRDKSGAQALTADNTVITIPSANLAWARGGNFKRGDVIRVYNTDKGWQVGQIPKAEGALVSIDPQDGALRAIVGGFDFDKSKYNRVTQSSLQPGSNFKPFIYSAGLAQGFTLASIINDAPIVIRVPGTNQVWSPHNAHNTFKGPMRLRTALIHSVNLVSVRLLEAVGVSNAIDFITRFGFDPKRLPYNLTLALGTAQVTPLEIATGYATFANGGYKVTPYFIDHITDVNGKVLYKADPKVACLSCNDIDALNPLIPPPSKIAPQVITPQNAFQMYSVLQDVIRNGTGRSALKLNRFDLAGKTGTTNDQVDAWFSGFNCDYSTTVWIGFDEPKSLHEYGAQAALPVWIDFMGKALKDKPEHTLPEPPGLVYVRIDTGTGMRAPPGSKGGAFEVFPVELEPQYEPYYDFVNYDYGANQTSNSGEGQPLF